ncbi:MAG: anti-sigma factor [Dehalococcoidia bacterium]
MNCEMVRELSGAWALDALPEDERLEFEGHIAGCENHADLAGLRAVAASVALAAEPIEPAAGLRERILASASPGRPAPVSLPERREERRGFRLPLRLPYALAAAFALLALGMLAWNIALQSGGDGGAVVRAFSGEGGTGTVTTIEDEELVVLRIDGLAELPEGQAYQAWALVGSEALSLGLVTISPGGIGTLAAGAHVPDIDGVAVTVEPAGGSPAPTSDPILVAEL